MKNLFHFLLQPGRVVTLIPAAPSEKVFGVAYQIGEEDRLGVMSHLDFREKNGYERYEVKFHPLQQSSSPIDLIVYVATEDNASYAGPKPIPDIARQILNSTGPSGRNRDYLYNLAEAFRQLFPNEHDGHLFALEDEVRRLERRETSQ